MHKRNPYKCPACGGEVPDLPMLVLKHQMSHVRRRPYSKSVAGPPDQTETSGTHHHTFIT
jgi:hypothetical protein